MSTHKTGQSKKKIFITLLCSGVSLGVAMVLPVFQKPSIISPIPEAYKPDSITIPFFTVKKNPDQLKKEIKDTIGDTWKNYSIYVIDANHNFSLGINEDVMFEAASVNKVPILAALYYKAQKGEVDLDKTITLQAEDIQAYGTGVIQSDPPGTTYSVKTLARLMMQKSDNTAAYILGNYVIGIDEIQTLVTSWGLTQTDIANNKTSNKDQALLFEKMFQGNIANKALTQEMLAFMKDSDFEDRIPGQLPSGTPVYHKIGTGIGEVHDVGIVVTPHTSYYIGILTSNGTDDTESTRLSSTISKIVYNFLK